MAYRNEPSLEELIAGTIDKKKSAKKNIIKANIKDNTKSFKVNIDYSKPNRANSNREIGQDYIDRSQFRNGRNYVSSTTSYSKNATSSADTDNIDPAFLKSLQQNFGNTNTDRKGRIMSQGTTPRKEINIDIPVSNNRYYDDFDNKNELDEYNDYNEYDSYPEYDNRKYTNNERKSQGNPKSVNAHVRKVSGNYSKNNKQNRNDVGNNYGKKEKNNKYKGNHTNFRTNDKRNSKKMDYTDVPKKKKRILPKVILILFILLIVLGGIVYKYIDKFADLFNYVPTGDRLDIPDVVSDKKITNILLIGADSRTSGNYGLSDTVILVSIRNDTKEIVMSSFMRDMYVQIPGQPSETWHKLNWSHSRGGPELLMDTLEFNFGIKIDNYVSVDFKSFVTIIDALGGLDISVTDAEANAMIKPMAEQNRLLGNSKGTDYIYEAGSYHMNGNQALAYSRIRKKVGDDFARTDRQREVLELIATKAKTMEIGKINSFVEKIQSQFTTNMEKSKVKELMAKSLILLGYDRISQRIPYGDKGESWEYGSSSTDGSIIVPDFELNKSLLMRTIYGK